MRSWTIPFGRVVGIELRLHTLFFILGGFAVSYGIITTNNGARGFTVWCLLLFAVLVRESARALTATCLGLELRSLTLLPIGALATYSVDGSSDVLVQDRVLRRMALVGPTINVLVGGIFGAIILAVSPKIDLLSSPWVVASHLLKALVWTNLLLGALNLLPVPPLDGDRLFNTGNASHRRLAGGLGQVIAMTLVVAGVTLGSVWFIIIGLFLVVGSHVENQGLLVRNEVGAVTLREVMLTDYTTLSASDTLEDALERAVHSLQDVFPVVRGGTIVGAVSRQSLVEALKGGGNSYVQGIMARTFETAHPDDALVTTLRRISGSGTTQFVPVLESERVVGIVTPNHLSHSIRLRSYLPRSGRGRDVR